MKKTKKSSIFLAWTKDVLLKSFAIFILVAAGIFTYAQINFPDDAPNDVSGVVGMFVGESEDAFTASTSYAVANAKCRDHSTNADIAGSHICTPDEMINSYNHGEIGVAPIYGQAGTLWVNNGPPAFTATANDCNGWTRPEPGVDVNNLNYGTVWNFNDQAGGLLPCTNTKGWACCK